MLDGFTDLVHVGTSVIGPTGGAKLKRIVCGIKWNNTGCCERAITPGSLILCVHYAVVSRLLEGCAEPYRAASPQSAGSFLNISKCRNLCARPGWLVATL